MTIVRHGLAVVEEGPPDASLVVLVHGAMDRMAGFARVARLLSGTHRVLRYDRRGYGHSKPHPGPFTIAANVDDLVTLLEGRPAVLVGHSLGGNVVLGAADLLGEQVRGVAIYETPLSWLPWWPGNSATVAVATSRDDPADVAERFMRRMVGERGWERLPASTREARRAEGPALVGEITDLRRAAPWDPSRIRVPVRVGLGTAASAHHQRGMATAAEWLPDATLVTLDGGHHLAHVAEAERFTDLLIRPLLGPDAG